MPKNIYAPPEDFIKIERGVLGADVAAGSSVTITLEDNDGFSDNDFVVIGVEGAEKTELQQIDAAVSGGTDIQVTTLVFAHKKGDPITLYQYNKRKFYGSVTETGTYVELTSDGSPVNIQVDDPLGTIIEYTGAEGFLFFKATYYNSDGSTAETDQADSAVIEVDASARYTSLYQIRVQAGLTQNTFINDGRIERKRKQAENEINSKIGARYSLPLSEVPAMLNTICDLLAGGYLDFEEFGPDGEGKKWLGEARGMLKSIMGGTQLLIGTDGTELTRNTNMGKLDGFPLNDGTDDPDTENRLFKIGDIH